VGTHGQANTLAPCLVIGRKGSFGKVNFSYSPVFAIDTTFFVDRRFTKADIRWLYYVLIDARLDRATKDSAVPGLDREDAYAREVCLCPSSEQRAIAAFLDWETAKIDALVEKKERLIALLQEKRTALISHAVTKGLDPTVPMKDSGVEWLGQIPAHWGVKPLKTVANFINGFSFKPEDWGAEGTPIIRIENLNGGEEFNYTTRDVPQKYWAEKDDLLFGWSGNRGTSFGPFLWWREGKHYVNQHIFRVVDFDADKRWFYWALRAVTFYVEKQAHGIIGMVHITRSELGSIPVPVLPRQEQRAIAAFLDRETAKIDALVAKVREAIERLKEYRTALISAAVTGKIDVREAVSA
jgi:type I restriction enzyme S subunit